VLRLLASLGVFAEVAPGSFALTPLGESRVLPRNWPMGSPSGVAS
jgi:hypothetical protein